MADTIRILVATDNHVGAHERDPHRSDDSWKAFHEIMELARDREVDMVLLAGDLFHENKPSRKSMYNVMRSIRLNCLGPRPCELEILSDGSEQFDPTFDHVNYEDPDINVSIPVFSIHGNHDDPSGEGHFAALDILAMSGLVNYFGRTPESDKIEVKPVLLQKGNTKLALYGLSNVRDERLYRTFKENKVTFFQASAQQSDWFNLICVHQNHYAHTETNFLPENFLPEFLDLVIWGHEHECLIDPTFNPEMNFHVMQPGSSIATSLIPGEAKAKHVSILSITGREFKSEPIRLTSVRPFIYKDIILAKDPAAVKIGKAPEHRTKLTAHLIQIVEGMIAEAKKEWEGSQFEAGFDSSQTEPPLPLIRLRVEYSHPDGISKFEVENPQRFSSRFQNLVANTNDVVQFHIRKRSAAASTASRAARDAESEAAAMSRVNLDDIRVEKLVKEFLEAQSLQILPQNHFGSAVNDFVDKDDKNALDDFVQASLTKQIAQLGNLREADIDSDEEQDGADLMAKIQEIKEILEAEYASGNPNAKNARNKKRYKDRPEGWDSEEDGQWEEQPGALIRDAPSNDQSMDGFGDSDEDNTATRGSAATRGRGRGRGGGRGAASSTRARGTTARSGKPAAIKSTKSRGKRPISDDEDEEEDGDVPMLDDDNDDDDNDVDDEDEEGDQESDSQAMFFSSRPTRKPTTKTTTRASNGTTSRRTTTAKATKPAPTPKAPVTRKTPARGTVSSRSANNKAAAATTSRTGTGRQGTLNFSASQASVLGGTRGAGAGAVADVESIDDSDDGSEGFEEVVQPVRRKR